MTSTAAQRESFCTILLFRRTAPERRNVQRPSLTHPLTHVLRSRLVPLPRRSASAPARVVTFRWVWLALVRSLVEGSRRRRGCDHGGMRRRRRAGCVAYGTSAAAGGLGLRARAAGPDQVWRAAARDPSGSRRAVG